MDDLLSNLADPLDDLSLGTETFLPPEDLLDHEDPQNDRFFRQLQSLRTHAATLSTKMLPRQVEAVRLHVTGSTNKAIATKLKYTQSAVTQLLRHNAKAIELANVLRRINGLLDGPNVEVRKNMLWRIAANSEMREPGTAIAALKELNKLDGAYAQPLQAPPQVQIVINQELMPRTTLDKVVSEQ